MSDVLIIIVAFVSVFALIGAFFYSVYNGSFEKFVYFMCDSVDKMWNK